MDSRKSDKHIDNNAVMWIRIHLGPWIRIQRYKMMGKVEFNQQKSNFFFTENYIF